MKRLIVFCLSIVLSTATAGLAAELHLDKQIELMQRQITTLQQELSILKSALVLADGNLTVAIKKDKRETVGAHESVDVAGNLQERIGASHNENVGSSRVISIGVDQSESIGRNLSL